MLRLKLRGSRLVPALMAAAAMTLTGVATLRGASPSFRDQIRAADVPALKVRLAGATSPNAVDDTGATPLMYAAAVGSIDTMRTILDAGADVNATGGDGMTALMWATGDVAKVRLLVERGANVNAKANNGTTTALVAAAQRGAASVVQYLLEHKADPMVGGDEGAALFQAAFATTNGEVRRVLDMAGLKPRHFGQIAPALGRVDYVDGDLVDRYLAVGGDANLAIPMVTVKMPVLGYAAMVTEPVTGRKLLDRGADPNGATTRGATPLMMAAASDHADPAMVRMLLDRGARVDAKDDEGRSALDWALMQGETDVARLLRQAGAPSTPASPTATTPVVSHMRPVKAAVQKALLTLETIGPSFNSRTGCVSCHNQSLPALARQMAGTRGITSQPAVASHATDATLRQWKPRRNASFVGACGGAGYVPTVTYGLVAMAEEGMPANGITDSVAVCLASRQSQDGAWKVNDVRPPLSGNPILYTALAIRALDVYAPPALRADTRRRIDAARAFLLQAEPPDTQDEAMKLIGLVWSKASATAIGAQARRVQMVQRANGGWGQTPLMSPDAYATGQALFALQLSGMSPRAAVYQRGAQYLLTTQREDGSWFVESRGFGFQPYRDYGFPHGRSQFISAAATSWAVMALAPVIDGPAIATN
jgi:ankyrin repeat protein